MVLVHQRGADRGSLGALVGGGFYHHIPALDTIDILISKKSLENLLAKKNKIGVTTYNCTDRNLFCSGI